MIHYHGSPLGGKDIDAASFFLGRHGLVSHAYPRQLNIIKECCQSFVLDNGAFTAWKQGRPLDVAGYLSWVRDSHQHPGFDWALIPDEIEGDEKANDALLKLWVDEMPKARIIGVPVWHLHESFERLESLIESWRTVALGSSGQWAHPGSTAWWRRMSDVLDICCNEDGRPRTRFHGLRMMDPEIFTRIPFASVDSTNAAVNQGSFSRFGSYLPPTAGLRATVIAARIESLNSPKAWTGPPGNNMPGWFQ